METENKSLNFLEEIITNDIEMPKSSKNEEKK